MTSPASSTLPARFLAGARQIAKTAGTVKAPLRRLAALAAAGSNTAARVAVEQSAQAAVLDAAIAGREGPWRSPA